VVVAGWLWVAALGGCGGGICGLAGEARADGLVLVSVVRVIDGDSLVTVLGKRRIEVRLADVDAPEWRQAHGRAARALAELLVGGSVRLRGRTRDGHGRLVSDVYLADGRSLAHVLVASGLAWYDGRFRTNASLAALEQSARAKRLGLWASARPVPPWEYRRKHRGRRKG
jgi:endonuclease YncB( thermonuclease family)